MAYQIHKQHVDLASGFHVVELRDGSSQHFVQIAIGADCCPACGHVTPKNNLATLNPTAMIAEVCESLNLSHLNMIAYSKLHNLEVK